MTRRTVRAPAAVSAHLPTHCRRRTPQARGNPSQRYPADIPGDISLAFSQRQGPLQAIINEIDGKISDGSKAAPVPAILAMNFQQVSVGRKLPMGSYLDGAGMPSVLLDGALAHVDEPLRGMVSELHARHLYDSTLIILSAKYVNPNDGSSPAVSGRLQTDDVGILLLQDQSKRT